MLMNEYLLTVYWYTKSFHTFSENTSNSMQKQYILVIVGSICVYTFEYWQVDKVSNLTYVYLFNEITEHVRESVKWKLT